MGVRLLLSNPPAKRMNFLAILEMVANRHWRKKNGICIAEGLRVAREAVTRRPEAILALFCNETFHASPDGAVFANLARQHALKLEVVPNKQFADTAETETPQGIAAIFRIPETTEPTAAGTPFTLILDHVSDPGNLGTILRTAWAVGLSSCWLVKGSADPFSPKAIRAGMGAQFALQTHLLEDLETAVSQARAFGAREVWCTMPAAGISIFDPVFQVQGSALIIGNEANGITRPDLGRAVTIPMPGHAESLNAAQAATVFLIESLRP